MDETVSDNQNLNVRLIYKDGIPVFTNGQRNGNYLFLEFDRGLEEYRSNLNIGPLIFSVRIVVSPATSEIYVITMQGGSVRESLLPDDYLAQKQLFKELVDKVCLAIKQHEELALTDFMEFWDEFDRPYFLVSVSQSDIRDLKGHLAFSDNCYIIKREMNRTA